MCWEGDIGMIAIPPIYAPLASGCLAQDHARGRARLSESLFKSANGSRPGGYHDGISHRIFTGHPATYALERRRQGVIILLKNKKIVGIERIDGRWLNSNRPPIGSELIRQSLRK
jgi:hypothetical protein